MQETVKSSERVSLLQDQYQLVQGKWYRRRKGQEQVPNITNRTINFFLKKKTSVNREEGQKESQLTDHCDRYERDDRVIRDNWPTERWRLPAVGRDGRLDGSTGTTRKTPVGSPSGTWSHSIFTYKHQIHRKT